jgi:phage tail tape-measure protein
VALDLGTLTAHLALDTSGWTASLRAVDASVNQVGSSLSGTLDVLTSWAAQAAIALAGVGLAAGTVYGGVLGAGAQMETFANQLTTMMGSAEAAKARLGELVQLAATTPFEIPEIVQAEVTLQSFGANTEQVMRGVIDYAAGANQSMSQAAIDIGKAWNQGAAGLESDTGKALRAAIALRTGVDLTKLSIEDFRAELVTELDTGKFAGGAMRLASTWTGIVSNLKDAWSGFVRQIADAGVFENTKFLLAEILNIVNQNQVAFGAWAKTISTVMWGAIKFVAQELAIAADNAELLGIVLGTVGSIFSNAAADIANDVLKLLNSFAAVTDALGQDAMTRKLDIAGDLVLMLRSGLRGMADDAGAWADSLNPGLDRLAEVNALLAGAEGAAAAYQLTGGAGRAGGTTAPSTAGKGSTGAPDAWIAALKALADYSDLVGGRLLGLRDDLDPTIAALGDMQKALEDAIQAVKDFWKGVGQSAVGLFGSAGSAVQSAVSAGLTAGVAGVGASIAMTLLSNSSALSSVADSLTSWLGTLAAALDPVVHGVAMLIAPLMAITTTVITSLAPVFDFLGTVLGGLSPIISALGALLTGLLAPLAQLANVFEPVLPAMELAFKALYVVMQVVGSIILSVVLAIQLVWNAILTAVETVVSAINVGGAFDSFLANLDDMKADTGATADALNTLMGTSYDQALAQNDAAASALETSSALDDVTASLTNVPSGYKVALARFDAISADAANALAGLASAVTSVGGGSSVGGTYRGTSGGHTGGTRREGRSTTHVAIAHATLRAVDVGTLADEARSMAERRSASARGTRAKPAPKYLGRMP